ncbi:MAG: 30S ribosome-binding factor RbfA, partial [Candidatus Zixiibacteriota bacterium]
VRVGEQILRDISSMMQTELADRSVGMVTFTYVKVSDDLRFATAYYSVLGKQSDREAAAQYLERERKRIQHVVGRNLGIRRIPELAFKYDPSIEDGIRIQQLLDEIKDKSDEQS